MATDNSNLKKYKGLTEVEKKKLQIIFKDPVLWAKAFVVAVNPETKKTGPWIARDYQAEILRNRDVRKVYRMGRRLGKSECMIVDALWQVCTHKNYRVLFITPYENQVELIFRRIREIVNDSPMIKDEISRIKNSPYTVEFNNGSVILGFTTGAASGSGAASVRGQRADWLFLDELDYMAENDYSTVAAIANERSDIGITASSTPTGRRGTFYSMCCDPNFHYTHWHFPSQRSPLWDDEMEQRARAEYSQQQYEHEVLAEFGTEEAGVFNKDALDRARQQMFYTYDRLTDLQIKRLGNGPKPLEYIYNEGDRAPFNLYRTVGIDWDKYGASSSIVVLDYDRQKDKFWVIKRIEVPRGEYSYDNAVKWVIRVNEIYNPRWIFADRGSGEYQIERLHIYGEEHKSSGLKNKLEGYQFKNTLDVPDPIRRTIRKEPMKPFMVNALAKVIEEDRLILSPFDDTLHKQLVDYCVERISANGNPVFTSKDEHFVDALGLAYLAMVLKFPEITQYIKKIDTSFSIAHTDNNVIANGIQRQIRSIESVKNVWGNSQGMPKRIGEGPGERKGNYQQWIKVPLPTGPQRKSFASSNNFFSRNPSRGGGGGRSMW